MEGQTNGRADELTDGRTEGLSSENDPLIYLIVQGVELLRNVSADDERQNILDVGLFHQQILQRFPSPQNVFAMRLS